MAFKSTTAFRAWLAVAVLWTIAMLNYLDRLMLTTMGEAIKVSVWEKAAPYPDPLGVAGAFGGVSGGALIAAGGANFPNGKPWEGGKKAWSSKIFVLEKPDGAWIDAGSLPRPLAYGVSASYGGRAICVGGCDGERNSAEAFSLKWNAQARKVERAELPALPSPLANACGAMIGSRLYVAGGESSPGAVQASSGFWSLNLEKPEEGWRALPSWPGKPRTLATAASVGDGFYVAGGIELLAGEDGKQARGEYFRDVFRFDPALEKWERVADMPHPLAAAPSPASSVSEGVFMLFGGDDGSEQAKKPQERSGFRRDALRFDARKNAWTVAGELPAEVARVTAPAVSWQGREMVLSGEIKAGERSPELSSPMTNAKFGLLTSVFLWVYALFSPLGGFLADRFSRSKVILGSLAVWSAVTWLTGHSHSLEALLAARAAMGISEAFYIPAALALISDFHRGPTRSLATGIHMSGLYAGAAMGGLGGAVAELYGWRSSFSLFGCIGVAYAALAALLLRDAKPEEGAPAAKGEEKAKAFDALRDLFSQGSFLMLLGYSGLLSVAFWLVNGWLPAFLQERFHLGPGAAGMSATFYVQAASFAGILAGGFLADRLSSANPRGRMLVPAAGFVAAAPFLFLSASTGTLWIAIAGLAVFGLSRGFSDANLMPVLCQVADSRYRATGYGILNFAGCVAGGAMIYAGGALKDCHVDLSLTFKFAAFCLFLAGLLMFMVKPRQALGKAP